MDTEVKYINAEQGAEIPAPRTLTELERGALKDWLPPTCRFEENQIMEASAYWRNVYRISSAYGPHLISILAQAGAIEAEQDPEQALRNVLKLAGF